MAGAQGLHLGLIMSPPKGGPERGREDKSRSENGQTLISR